MAGWCPTPSPKTIMSDPKEPTPDPTEAPKPDGPQAEKEGRTEDKAAPEKPRYVFKILPADPKNSFDFEDVADK